MPRVKLIAEDGWVAWDERVTAADFGSEHFRAQLAERLALAAADAEARDAAAPGQGHDPRWARSGEAEPALAGG